MTEITIPSTFKLVNRTWRVQRKRMKSDHGRCNSDLAIIWLDDRLEGELLLHTFVHEVLHATSRAMGWDKVDRDESRIDALAGLLVQVFETAA